MTWPRWWAWTAATPTGQHRGHRDAQADLHEQRRAASRDGRGGAAAHRSDRRAPRRRAGRRASAPKARSSGAPASASTTWAESAAGEGGHLVVPAAAPGEEGGNRQRDEEREAERQGGPRQDEPDGHGADDGRPGGDRHRQQRAQVEVLQRIDVVDGAGQQVAAAPSCQRGRHPGGEAVVEPHPPARQRAQGRVMADEPLGVAQRSPQEGQHLDRGQDADQRRQARSAARRARRRSPTRPAGRWSRRRRRGPAGRPAPGARTACPARPGRAGAAHACLAHGATANGRPVVAGKRDHQVEVGEEHGLVRRHHDRASGEPGLDRRARGGPRSAGRAPPWARRAAAPVPDGAGRGPGPRAGARPSSA